MIRSSSLRTTHSPALCPGGEPPLDDSPSVVAGSSVRPKNASPEELTKHITFKGQGAETKRNCRTRAARPSPSPSPSTPRKGSGALPNVKASVSVYDRKARTSKADTCKGEVEEVHKEEMDRRKRSHLSRQDVKY